MSRRHANDPDVPFATKAFGMTLSKRDLVELCADLAADLAIVQGRSADEQDVLPVLVKAYARRTVRNGERSKLSVPMNVYGDHGQFYKATMQRLKDLYDAARAALLAEPEGS